MPSLQILEKRLADLGVDLERTRARRLESKAELHRLSELAEKGDNKAVHAQVAVNKRIGSDSTAIVTLGYEISEVRRQCDLARGQLAAMELKAAAAESSATPRDKLFEVATPKGTRVRNLHSDADSLQKLLLPGYRVVAEVIGADVTGKGGIVEPLGQSTMHTLLDAYGDQLLTWLAERGIVADKPVAVILPSNGRENMQ